MVEHKTDLLARLADEVAVLVGGRIVRSGPALEVLSDPELAGMGVEPPSDVRLRRAANEAGVELDPAWLRPERPDPERPSAADPPAVAKPAAP